MSDHHDSSSGTGSEHTGAGDPRTTTGEPVQEPAVVPQLTPKQSQRVSVPARAMIISMAALLLLVLPFFMLQPRPDGQSYRPDVDVAQEASYAAEAASFEPLAPDLGGGWSPNYARWQGAAADGVDTWEAGWVTPAGRFLGLNQTDAANPTWTQDQIDGLAQTGTADAGGITWAVHTGTAEDDEPQTAWIGELDDSTVILQGSADAQEFEHAAEAVASAADGGT